MMKQKSIGDKVENEIVEYLRSIGLDAHKNLIHSLRYSHDVEIHGQKSVLTFEAKADRMASKTGNIAIEFWNSRKNEPSGISRTSATFWCHEIDGIIWVIPVEKLKLFLKENLPAKTIIAGGDSNADLYLYRIDDFTKNCTNLKDLKNVEDFINLL